MDNLESLTDQMAEMRGQLLAMECVINALVMRLPPEAGLVVQALHATEVEAYGNALATSKAPLATIESFERQIARSKQMLNVQDIPLAGKTEPTS